AFLIEKPTVNGQTSPFPLAINTFGSNRRMAMSLGVSSVEEVATELGSLIQAKPPTSFKEITKLLSAALELRHAKAKIVRSGPCKEIVHKFDAPGTRIAPWPSAPKFESVAGSGTSAATLPEGNSGRPLPTLLDLPIQKCWPLDGGRFITLP